MGRYAEVLQAYEAEIKEDLVRHTAHLTANMEARGGGMTDLFFAGTGDGKYLSAHGKV